MYDKIQKFLASLAGKKSYIVAFVGATVALLQAFGVNVDVNYLPEWFWHLLEFAGLAALRAAISKQTPTA